MLNNPIVQLIVLLIVGYVVSLIPMDALIRKIAFLVISLAVLVVLLRWLFPGII
jgi:hypothetical protein